jgi:hypothetical protein
MNITSAQYIFLLDDNSTVDHIQATIDDKQWSVPMDPANRHYQAILEWVEDGNTIEEAD